MNTAFSSLLTGLLVQLPGCPSALIEDALKRAAIRFYEETWCWRDWLPEVICADGADAQLVTAPAGIAVEAVTYLKGLSALYSFEPPRTVRFFRPPPDGASFTPMAVLKPSYDAVSVPAGHPDQWLSAWEYGALYRLQTQVNQPWYNAEEAARNEIQFHQAVMAERSRRNKEHRGADVAVTPRPLM